LLVVGGVGVVGLVVGFTEVVQGGAADLGVEVKVPG
jgi:hypothetical protein